LRLGGDLWTMSAMKYRLGLGLVIALAAACDPAPPPAKSAADSPGPTKSATRDGAPVPVTALKRAEVKATIAQGLGVFLQNVTVDDWPVMHDGKFHGFKIKTINPDWGVDLRPGDVVTKVNGIVPERPEEADAALRSLDRAPSLKVEFERDGKPRTLELPIVD
jgi:type II secretory pathway component PulC